MATKLTATAKAGGCASKLSPKILDRALKALPSFRNDRVLVGYNTADDAGVYDLTEPAGNPIALVQTVDFFTPIVDDPYVFGGIAAANALSDIYAMGGHPVTALSLLVYPPKGDMQDLEAMLMGGADKIHESGCVILGGHSIAEDEIKFGFSVTGLVNPNKVWSNAGAKADDVLLFTKKIGTGVISTALKRGLAASNDVDASVQQMLTLNRDAAAALTDLDVHACTDVTGFGLLGHAREMAIASDVTLRISASAVQLLPGALEYSERGAYSAGLTNNRDFVESCVQMGADIPSVIEALLYDPQTSGGLLVSLAAQDANEVLARRPEAYRIGSVMRRGSKPIEVIQ